MMAASAHPMIFVDGPFTKGPIFRRSPVNWIRGITANDNWIGTVSLLVGNGDGTFMHRRTFSTGGHEPTSVAIGDLNGDGHPDLATTNNVSNTVSVLPGTGHGRFPLHVAHAVGSGPQGVAIGDLNGDGQPDLVTANLGSNSVTVVPNVIPVITTADPNAARVGQTVVLTGIDLTGAVAVWFDGVAARFRVISNVEIDATVPDRALNGPVIVTTPDLGTGRSAASFGVLPSIAGFTPREGPVGTTVVITGWAFTGATEVSFNGVSASFTVDSYHQITATVPAGATSGPIGITTPQGVVESAHVFTVT